jgi:enterochelin esterase-like enzyme
MVAAVVWLMAGMWGTWAYGHDYDLYRGFPPPTRPAGVTPGRLASVSFFSPALGARRRYEVYLPAGYASAARRGERFGVLYLLHGSPGRPSNFVLAGDVPVTIDELLARGKLRHPYLVVMPDGRDGSYRSDTEWADTRHGRYGSFVLDVVRDVDRRFATRPSRRWRAIAGNSEGAYAAVNLALRHLGTFGIAESWSGYFTQTPTGVFRGASAAALRAASPADYVGGLRHALRRHPLHVLLYGGRRDRDTLQLPGFVARLRAAGADVTSRILPGHHDWRLWRDEAPWALRYVGRHLGAP